MVKIIFGTAGIAAHGQEQQNEILDLLLTDGITNLDTARIYTNSEDSLGKLEKRTQFTIDTKLAGGFGGAGSISKENVIKDAQDSLDRVGIKQFDILYIHAPDVNVPIEETLEGINEVYKKGIFRRFGLSNYSAEQVQQVYDIAKAKGYPLPAVYQGNYNPVARHYEELLFPTLRKLGIHFYAYSPLAGGFLTKTSADLDAGVGRFNAQAVGGLYKKLYDKPSLREALAKWNEVADKEGVSKAELAYRWVVYHSALKGDDDGILFGASSVKQVEQTVKSLQGGPLSEEATKAIEEIWQSVKDDAPIDNYASSRG